jgi:hypothetical protein
LYIEDNSEGLSAMTIHLVLLTADGKSFVWATDALARLGKENYGTIEKITYLKDLNIACSIWGDSIAIHASDELVRRAMVRPLPSADPSAMTTFLQNFGAEMLIAEYQKQQSLPPVPRGILLATLGENPRVYSLSLGGTSLAVQIIGQVNQGDGDNPALLFPGYYFERCGKSIPELIALAVHTIRVAGIMNGKGIRSFNVWVCQRDTFRRLEFAELLPYLRLSESIDATILEQIKSIPSTELSSGAE